MVKIKIKDLPTKFKKRYTSLADTLILNRYSSNPSILTDIAKKMTNMDVKYYDNGGIYDNDELEFNSEQEYTLFLLKFSS